MIVATKILVFTMVFILSLRLSFAQDLPFIQNQQIKPTSVQENPQNELGLIYFANRIEAGKKYLEENNLTEAEKILKSATEELTDITQLHFDLFQSLNKYPLKNLEAKMEKAHAIDFGKLRDQSSFLLAKTYIEEKKLKDALKLLVEIIKSQPNSEIGKESYKALIELNFSDKVK